MDSRYQWNTHEAIRLRLMIRYGKCSFRDAMVCIVVLPAIFGASFSEETLS